MTNKPKKSELVSLGQIALLIKTDAPNKCFTSPAVRSFS